MSGNQYSENTGPKPGWRHRCTISLVLVGAAVCWCQSGAGAGETASAPLRGVLRHPEARQLPTAVLDRSVIGLPVDWAAGGANPGAGRELPGRAVPALVPLAEAGTAELSFRLVPLPGADTLARQNLAASRFGRLQFPDGTESFFNPEMVLVKLRGARHVGAMRTEAGRELDTARAVAARPEVEFAELDVWQKRQFTPNDPQFGSQWHHGVIGSPAAWDRSRGRSEVRIAIVDTPFQMNHPDLAAHVLSGWNVVTGVPVTNSAGIDHSTMCAGMAAAVINNGQGIAGVSDCSVLPINIAGAISQMYGAVIWAADHGVRVVSISWTGADSDSLNVAGAYLRTQARGLLFMAGVNGIGFLDYPNQPDIWCVSMTDAADNMQSRYGLHIDFAAPGWRALSTATGGGYGMDSGTSYATPLVAGVAGVLMSINPALTSEEVISILKTTAADFGAPGWDMFFGWGRVDFAAAATAASASVPRILRLQRTGGDVRVFVPYHAAWSYSLQRANLPAAGGWQMVPGMTTGTNGNELWLIDPAPPDSGAMYRVGFGSW